MNEKTPFDWARLAAAAATIKAAEVTVVANPSDPDLPAISIGDTIIRRVRVRSRTGHDTGARTWDIGLYPHDTLAEALTEAVSQEVYRRVEEALGTKGLAT